MVLAYEHCLCSRTLDLSWLPTDQLMGHMGKSLAFLDLCFLTSPMRGSDEVITVILFKSLI